MDWESQLIATYLIVCEAWQKGICYCVKRYSNNHTPAFTDQEAVSLYLFGIMTGHTTLRGIYNYADRHLRDWFPDLCGYEAFNYRMNILSDGLVALAQCLVERAEKPQLQNWVVDSLPIVMAGPKRSQRAKVAPELADKGFCASKDLYFYGVKLHFVSQLVKKSIPMPGFVALAPASASDHKMFEQISSELENLKTFADKAYADTEHKKNLQEKQNVELLTPIKKTKNQFSFPGADAFSTWVSGIRQPI